MMYRSLLLERKSCVLVLVVMMVFSIVPYVFANPIPTPTLILQREDISIFLKKVDDLTLEAYVRGVYPFANVGYKSVDMFFPIPREAAEKKDIKIWLNDKEVPWVITEKGYMIPPQSGEKVEFTYETVDGVYPLIKWSIQDLPEKFEITVEYSYTVKVKDGEFRTLYAMATGRFADVYAKRCTAYVTLDLTNFQGYNASVNLVPPPSLGIGSSRFQFIVRSDNEKFNVTEESSMFNGLSRDVQIILKSKSENQWEWRPYTPKNLKLRVDINKDRTVNVTANILFNHGGFKIDWGQVYYVKGYLTITIDAKVLEYTGPVPEVMMNMTHSYIIGPVEPGNYILRYRVNNVTLETIDIIVPEDTIIKQGDFNDSIIYILLGLPIAAVIILVTKKALPSK